MTKEILKYMEVQPPDTILLPKSAYEMWGTR